MLSYLREVHGRTRSGFRSHPCHFAAWREWETTSAGIFTRTPRPATALGFLSPCAAYALQPSAAFSALMGQPCGALQGHARRICRKVNFHLQNRQTGPILAIVPQHGAGFRGNFGKAAVALLIDLSRPVAYNSTVR